ncbi:MAG: isochorismatase family protein [Thermodesulfobacteriota bacterium]
MQTTNGLTPYNSTIVLLDYQSRFALTLSSTNGETLIQNAVNLAKVAITFSVPTVLTTVGETSFGGPILSKLQEVFPDQKPIDRIAVNPWEDGRIIGAVEKAGRHKLVVAGLWTDFGVAHFVRGGLQAGYDVYPVVDACADMSAQAHRIAVERMIREGARPITWLQLLMAFHRQSSSPDAYKILLNIVNDHANVYGLNMQYADTSPAQGRPRWSNNKPRESRWGKWPMAQIRSQKRV